MINNSYLIIIVKIIVNYFNYCNFAKRVKLNYCNLLHKIITSYTYLKDQCEFIIVKISYIYFINSLLKNFKGPNLMIDHRT